MYIYAFDRYAGTDRVYKYIGDLKAKAGDVIAAHNTHFLVLGEDIMFMELYTYTQSTFASYDVVYKKLLSTSTIEIIHRLVYTYYSTYKKVIALFVPGDIAYILAKKASTRSIDQQYAIAYDPALQQCVDTQRTVSGQELRLFPDIRTMHNITTQNQRDSNLLRHSKSTPLQKVRLFWQIQKEKKVNYLTTYAGIFQNRTQLSQIHFFYPHKWYYANQQDPKYKTQEVIKKLAELHQVPVSYIQE